MANQKPIYIVGHNDVDGLGAHALMEKRFQGRKTVHYFLDYPNMEEVFSKVRDGAKDSEVVFVDLSVTGKAEYISSVLRKLKENGNRMSWYDHHDRSEQAVETLSGVLDELVLDKGICTTEIIQKKHFPNDKSAKRLARIAHSSDFENKNDSREYKMAMRLDDAIAYANVQDGKNKNDSVRSKIVGKLAKGATVEGDCELAEFYFLYQPIKRKALGRLDASITYRRVAGYRAALAIFPEELAKKPAILRLKEKTSKTADIFVGVAPNGRLSVSASDGVPEKCFLKLVAPFNGGGRGRIGGGQLNHHEPIGESNYREAFGLITERMDMAMSESGCTQ